jgi:Leucine-rich repeat (LRR) protein
LTGAGLKGPISPAIGQLVNLESLILDNNVIVDPIPVEIGNLVRLRDLSLMMNNLTSIPPDALLKCNLTNLSVTCLQSFLIYID